MNIVDINPEELVFYENNPRDNDEAVPIIANSIERFGFKVPVMIDSNKVIICGHTRVKAALNLGLETVPCIVEEEMSEDDIRAFRIVENKTHELSFWDSSLLRQEMDALDEIDWQDFGFDEVQGLSDEEMQQFFADTGSAKTTSPKRQPILSRLIRPSQKWCSVLTVVSGSPHNGFISRLRRGNVQQLYSPPDVLRIHTQHGLIPRRSREHL